MEAIEAKPDPKGSKKQVPKRPPVFKKLDVETAKLLVQIREKVNKKTFGRRVIDSEIFTLGLSLITTEHIKQLQEKTLSERDRLQMVHEEYQRINGKITLDQYIGLLLRGEVKTTN